MSKRRPSDGRPAPTKWQLQEIAQNMRNFLSKFSLRPQPQRSTVDKGSPILALPFEIIALIFEIARESAPIHTSRKAQGTDRRCTVTRSEIIFSHVCRHWRDVALASPTLWSDFVHLSPDQPILLSWLATYLERSGQTPLNLSLHVKTKLTIKRGGGGPTTSNMVEVLDMLIAHASRWRCLSIVLVDHWLLSLHKLVHVSAPNLEVFEMKTTGSHPHSPSMRVLFRGSAPKLSRVTMAVGLFVPCPPPFTMKTLELGHSQSPYSWESFLDIISIRTLENLTIVGQCFKEPSLNARPVVAHNLKVLRLLKRCDTASYLWQCNLRAPRLETLAISGLTIDRRWALPDRLQDSVSDSDPFPSLKRLALSNCQVSSDRRLLRLAQATSSVEHLVIQSRISRTNIVKHTMANRENPALWPRLEIVTYLGHSYVEEDTDPDMYAGLVDWRREMFERRCVLQVEHRWISVWVCESEQLLESWKQLNKTGLLEIIDCPTATAIWPPPTNAKFDDISELLFTDWD